MKTIGNTKRVKFAVSVTPAQMVALQKLMDDDMQTNRSAYFGLMIGEITKYRNKPKAGRPKNEPEEEEPAIYLHPDQSSIGNKGRRITKTELDWYNEHHGKLPKN